MEYKTTYSCEPKETKEREREQNTEDIKYKKQKTDTLDFINNYTKYKCHDIISRILRLVTELKKKKR